MSSNSVLLGLDLLKLKVSVVCLSIAIVYFLINYPDQSIFKMVSLHTYILMLFSVANRWLGYWGKHMKSEAFKHVKPYQKVTILL